ncbi:acetyltransferase [candidate division KSB1 bacterium]|nr:acetyltransferase [candidate division KSB1 bacterium]
MNTKVIIYGAGQNGRVVVEILKATNRHSVVGFIDDNHALHNKTIVELPVLGDRTALDNLGTNGHIKSAFVSIGNNKIRAQKALLMKEKGFALINIIHESAIISESVELGENVQIGAGAIINTNSKIGNNVIINTAATIDHDNEIGDNVQICPGVHLAGVVKIQESSFIGTGAIVINNVTIGKNVVVGAGTLVLKDVPDNAVIIGVPGKVREV